MSEAGVWRSTLCPADGCGSNGVVTSPNYPADYPNDLEKTQRIQVEDGLILSLEFTAFSIELDYITNNCRFDYLTITDGDGTTLMGKSCGSPYDGNTVYIGGQKIDSTLPPNIRSRTNAINIFFRTSHRKTRPGWSISWSAEMPSQSPQPTPTTTTGSGKCHFHPKMDFVILGKTPPKAMEWG